MTTGDSALAYRQAALCVLPANLADKRPDAGNWKQYQNRLPTDEELRRWFKRDRPMCLVAGPASDNLEMIDFDCGGEKFVWWRYKVELQSPGLVDQLVLERSPSGGWHAAYRHESDVYGNLKLAERQVVVPENKEYEFYGKKYKPAKVGNQYVIRLTVIETRGEGGIFLCDPTPGYVLTQGRFEQLPVITEEQRMLLLETAWSLTELKHEPDPEPEPKATSHAGVESDGRPGDDFNERGDIRPTLRAHGWTLKKRGDNEYWCRPGKSHGTSATLKDNVFYVFSTNAFPFEPGHGYSNFHTYTLLEHGKNEWSAAAAALRQQGYGDRNYAGLPSHPVIARERDPPKDPPPEDPGPIPSTMLRVPGFVSEVMDYCLETAPYPNPVLAFCGALSLQAFLAGRKVRDQADNRTNLYLLGLAYSSAGKDSPRKLNARVLHHIGLEHCLGDGFASGEGVQDLMYTTQSMLFQTDEIDGLLQSINKAKDARHEYIMNTLLRMYSASNGVFTMRPKAGKDHRGSIDQPCLTIFGTAVPTHYYQALSERMLTNGFFARMIVAESGPRGSGQEPRICDIPKRVLLAAKWWSDFRPVTGNLHDSHPTPAIVEYTAGAEQLLIDGRRTCESEYAKAEKRGDSVGTTVWGRVNESSRKLALVYAVSENHVSPLISEAAAAWGIQFATHQARRMLFQVQGHVADNPFEAECLKFLKKLWEAPGQELPHSIALKRMKMDARHFLEMVTTLEQRGDIEILVEPRPGTPGRFYRVRGER